MAFFCFANWHFLVRQQFMRHFDRVRRRSTRGWCMISPRDCDFFAYESFEFIFLPGVLSKTDMQCSSSISRKMSILCVSVFSQAAGLPCCEPVSTVSCWLSLVFLSSEFVALVRIWPC